MSDYIVKARPVHQLSDEPVEYRIPGLLTMRGHVLISAYRKGGKSSLMWNLAVALTSRADFLGGLRCTQLDGTLVYADFELEENMTRKYAVEQGHDLDSGEIQVQPYRGKASKFLLGDKDWREDYAAYLRELEAAALVIDPIHVVASVGTMIDSNSNDESRAVMELLGEIADLAELHHLFVVDHTGHGDKTRARGASAKEDWADIMWNITTPHGEDDPRRHLSVHGRGAAGSADYEMNDAGLLVLSSGTSAKDVRVDQIRRAREEHPGWTIYKVSKETEIPYSTVSRLWAKAGL